MSFSEGYKRLVVAMILPRQTLQGFETLGELNISPSHF